MKHFLFVPLLIVMLCSCGGNDKKKTDTKADTAGNVLAESIEYDVVINNYDEMDPWINNIQEPVRTEFVVALFNELTNKHGVDNEGKPVSAGAVLQQIKDLKTDLEIQVSDPVELIRNKSLVIDKIRFRERWTYSPDDYRISKTVLAIAPVLELADEDGYIIQSVPLFWIPCDTTASGKEITVLTSGMISDAIVYNQLDMILEIDSTPADNYSNLKDPERATYFDGIMNNIISKKQKGYNYNFDPLSDEEMKGLKGRTDTLVEYDDNKVETTKVVETLVTAQQLGRIKFAESWEYSVAPFTFHKTVIGLNPSLFVIDPTYEVFNGFKPLFWVIYEEEFLKDMQEKMKIQATTIKF